MKGGRVRGPLLILTVRQLSVHIYVGVKVAPYVNLRSFVFVNDIFDLLTSKQGAIIEVHIIIFELQASYTFSYRNNIGSAVTDVTAVASGNCNSL